MVLNAVDYIQKHDTRIVVGGFYEDMALRVFCEVSSCIGFF